MITTISKVWKGLNLLQLIKDIDYWFWALMLITAAASATIVQTTEAVADVKHGVQVLAAQRGALTEPEQPVSDAYLTLRGVSLGIKYRERGVLRNNLEETLQGLLQQHKINQVYMQAILAGYDRDPVAK